MFFLGIFELKEATEAAGQKRRTDTHARGPNFGSQRNEKRKKEKRDQEQRTRFNVWQSEITWRDSYSSLFN